MLAKSTKSILIVCLLFSLVLSIFGCVTSSSDPNSVPVKELDITMDVNHLEEFRAQLRKFADKYSLKFTISFADANKKNFFVVMYGEGFHIAVSNSMVSPGIIDIGFLNEYSALTPQKTVDKLVDDLKSFINEIPNVTIKEKIKSLRITMAENQSQELFAEFFAQLRDFADQHALEFTISSYDSGLEIFLVEMYGDGFQITSEVIPSGIGKMYVNFYIHYDNNGVPTSTSQGTVDELFNDLKSFFGEIPNVTITEEK